jgi:Family of unknown function (DUF5995)
MTAVSPCSSGGRWGMPSIRLVTLLVAAALVSAPALARADDPPFVPWSALLPGLTMEYQPDSENLCSAGRTRCVDAVVREMQRRFDPLATSCDHNAIFLLVYLRVTQEYRRTVADPTFFQETNFVNHEDAVFARAYFDAYDAWHAGNRGAVPGAWAAAFQAAADRSVTSSGDLLLGINAHVQRDLPFVLAAIGLVKPDGSSRKRDHDKVNEILNRAYDDVYAEIAARFDNTFDDTQAPGTADDFTLFQTLVAWREVAWRNAERLVTAPTPAARALVAASIEASATSQAEAIRLSAAYGPTQSTATRDAYCATHG